MSGACDILRLNNKVLYEDSIDKCNAVELKPANNDLKVLKRAAVFRSGDIEKTEQIDAGELMYVESVMRIINLS